jgi:hypothetical protein
MPVYGRVQLEKSAKVRFLATSLCIRKDEGLCILFPAGKLVASIQIQSAVEWRELNMVRGYRCLSLLALRDCMPSITWMILGVEYGITRGQDSWGMQSQSADTQVRKEVTAPT